MSLVCSGWVVFYDCCLIVFSLTIVAGEGGKGEAVSGVFAGWRQRRCPLCLSVGAVL